MRVSDFIAKAKEIEQMKTVYKLGGFMRSRSESGAYECDCSGLIKAIFWGYPYVGTYASNGLPDINANTMIKRCEGVSSDFTSIEHGEVVWLKGHIGIYVGNGCVIESTPAWNNCVQYSFIPGIGFTNTKGYPERRWTKHGKFIYVDYDTMKYYPKTSYKGNSIVDALKQEGIRSDFASRYAIAKKNGISDYRGTAAQNITLLNKLKNGKLLK